MNGLRADGFLIDTGPLLDHVIIRFLARQERQSYERVRIPAELVGHVRGLIGPDVRRAFARLMADEPRRATVAGVVVELHALARRQRRLADPIFYEELVSAYRTPPLIESCRPVGETDPAWLARIGPVDEQLLRGCKDRGWSLVTIDHREIRARAADLGVAIVNPEELIDIYG